MAKVFRFDEYTLDLGAFQLCRGPVIVPVEPLVFDLITLLLERPGEVVSRDTLVEVVWKGRMVSDSTVSTAIKSARKALRDSGREQKYIRTVRGRGIRFAVPVETVETTAVAGAPRTPDVATQPALYIRPFGTLGDDRLDPVAKALRVRTRSILSRVPLLRIATSFRGADEIMDPRELRARFGVTHVLDVRVQREGPKLTADAALTETRDGLQIWAQQFEAPSGAGDQEILLHEMIRRLEPRLMQAMVTEMKTAGDGRGPRAGLMEAIALVALKGWHRTTFVEATAMIETAIAQDPDCALSHAYLALLKALGHRVGLLRHDDTIVPAAIAAADRALDLENQDSTVLGLAGCALADVGQVDRALPILERAIELDPENGHAKTALGAALMMKRDYEGAVRYLTEGIACSPADSRLSVWGTSLALAQLARGDPDGALRSALDACKEDDRIYLPRLALAAVHLAREDRANAVAAVRECLRTKPDLTEEETVCIVGAKLGAGVWSIARSLRNGSA